MSLRAKRVERKQLELLITPHGQSGGTIVELGRERATAPTPLESRRRSGTQSTSYMIIPRQAQTLVSINTSEMDSLRTEIEGLRRRVDELEQKVSGQPVEEEITLRSMDKDQAKIEIRRLFDNGEVLYYSDIANRLGIDLAMVVEVCTELMREGEIEVANNAF